MKKMNKKGFTIVELVIVIAVIAILAAVLIPTFSGVVNKANDSSALQTAQNTLKQALLMTTSATISDGSVIVLDTDKSATTRPNYVYRYGNDTLDAKTDVYANDDAVVFNSNILDDGTNSVFLVTKAVTVDGETAALDGISQHIIESATGWKVGAVEVVKDKDNKTKSNEFSMRFDYTTAKYSTDKESLYTKSGDTYAATTDETPVAGKIYYKNTGTEDKPVYVVANTVWTIYTSDDFAGTNVVVFTKIG